MSLNISTPHSQQAHIRELAIEAEQSRAISYTDPSAPSWGDAWTGVTATPESRDVPGLRPVGSYPDGASDGGVMDLVGNASEWVADWFNWEGYGDLPARNPVSLGPEWNRALRGSSWVPYGIAHWAQERSRCSARNSTHRGVPDARFGFRCARTLE